VSTLAVDQITDNSGGSTTTINGLTPTPSNMMGRNKIINGKMEIAQRGTSFAGVTTGAYRLDRWSMGFSSTAVVTVTQQADAPSNNEFQYSHRIAVTTADTSIAAGDLMTLVQPIEGYNVRDLIGKTFTLSFWVRSSKTGTHCVRFANSNFDRSYVAEYTVSAANTWEQKSITVSGGLITAGTWDWTNVAGLRVEFTLAAGTTFQTTAGAWQTGNFIATSNQVNCLDTIGNIFAITGVQLEVGSVATPFEHRPYTTELQFCQRYYYSGVVHNVTQAIGVSPFHTHPVTMRAAPTITATLLSGGTTVYATASNGVVGHRYFPNGGSGGTDYTVTYSIEL
jgi:hypothetical protein